MFAVKVLGKIIAILMILVLQIISNKNNDIVI